MTQQEMYISYLSKTIDRLREEGISNEEIKGRIERAENLVESYTDNSKEIKELFDKKGL